jgi:hypothetical protein
MGVISRLIMDLLGEVYIPSSGTRVEASYMIGEIYGEKLKMSLLDNEYSECFYIWDVSNEDNPKEKVYTSDLMEVEGVSDLDKVKTSFINKMNVLEMTKNIYYNPLT